METDDFILVVVSEVESTSGRRPRIYIIPSPLQQLEVRASSAVRLNGLRGAHSFIYEFQPEQEE